MFVNNGFSLFFELLDNLAIHVTWPSEEDPAELRQLPFVDLSNSDLGPQKGRFRIFSMNTTLCKLT